MTVVSDTSPINYLVLIELQDLLPALFEHEHDRYAGVLAASGMITARRR
jgi:hypothetical protein